MVPVNVVEEMDGVVIVMDDKFPPILVLLVSAVHTYEKLPDPLVTDTEQEPVVCLQILFVMTVVAGELELGEIVTDIGTVQPTDVT